MGRRLRGRDEESHPAGKGNRMQKQFDFLAARLQERPLDGPKKAAGSPRMMTPSGSPAGTCSEMATPAMLNGMATTRPAIGPAAADVEKVPRRLGM